MARMLLALILLGCLAGAVLFSLVCWRARVWLRETERAGQAPADCVIVLGARVYPDGRMSRVLKSRTEAALAAWKDGRAERLIVCGARGGDEPRTEADAMAEFLRAEGVPEECLFLDEESFDTRQNIANAGKIMAEHGWETALIATSDYHVQRSLWMARDAGIRAQGLAAATPRTFRAYWWGRIRESVSWALYFMKII